MPTADPFVTLPDCSPNVVSIKGMRLLISGQFVKQVIVSNGSDPPLFVSIVPVIDAANLICWRPPLQPSSASLKVAKLTPT